MAVAEVFEFDPVAPAAHLDAAFAGVVGDLRRLRPEDALAMSDRWQNQLLAFDADVIAEQIAAGANSRQAEDLAGRGTTRTSAEAKRRAQRGQAVNANPTLADDLAEGRLGPAGLDAIADAARRTDGAAALSPELIEDIKAGSPDDAKRLANQWVDDHMSPEQHEKRRARQRRLRSVRRYLSTRGTEIISAEGDTESIEEIWSVLKARSKKLFREDGGRDVPPNRQQRTRDQRMFDALHEAVTSDTEDDGTDSKPAVQVYVTTTIDDFIGDRTKARLVGGGTIPRSLFRRYLPDADIVGVIFGGDGQVLWHGRTKRYATAAQISALRIRDEGCVLCGRDAADCEAHHVIPFHAPAKGRTNTDELALVDTDCHHHIHANELTLDGERTSKTRRTLRWRLRPATADELPP